MQNSSTRKWTLSRPSRAMEDAVDRLVQTRMANSVQTSLNIRVRLAQRISTVCRDVIASFLEDEKQAVSAQFASDAIKDEFTERHEQARMLLSELDELDPTQNNGLVLLGKVANLLKDYVHWEDEVLYPSIQTMLQENESSSAINMIPRPDAANPALHQAESSPVASPDEPSQLV